MEEKENNYSDEYDTEDEPKKFQIKRWMLIVGIIVLVAIIVLVIILVSRSSDDDDYTTDDFLKLEERMEEEAQTYVSQKGIELSSEDYIIDLSELLVENGGFIDPDSVKAANVCVGYVIAKEEETQSYDAYISCGDMYTTAGYVSNLTGETSSEEDEQEDTEEPTITLIGDSKVTINKGSTYEDEGATAMDNVDGDITSKIKVENNVDTSTAGTYTVTYSVTDEAGNTAKKTRTVVVVETTTTTTSKTTTKSNSSSSKTTTTTQKRITTTSKITTAPTITLKGNSYMEINQGATFTDPGYSATDATGTDITSRVSVSGSVNTSVAGTYTIKYTVTDSYGNSSSKTRTVKVISTTVELQSITLTPNSVTLSAGKTTTISVLFNPTNATNKTVSWSSSNPSVATVSNGVITAVKAGTATITATASGKTAYVSVRVE